MLYCEYQTKKKQYQEAGAEMLLSKKHACLFFSPGKGKTYPVIDALLAVDKEKNGEAKCLIISSKDAIEKMWKADIVPQHILPKNTVLVTDRTAIGQTSKSLISTKWDVIIVDECHIVKSNSSHIHRLVYILSKKTEYVWGMTGTPRGNSDIDIWCQLQAMAVGNQERFSYSAWCKIYCDFETGYGAGGRQFEKPVKIKDKYMGWWQELLDTYCMFVDYDEDDDMPSLDIDVVKIPYVKTDYYNDAIEGIIRVGDFATTTEKVVAISKAHQACNGYLYLPDKSVFRIEKNAKLDYLDAYVKNDRCVIVYKHIADYEDLKKKFGDDATNDVDIFKRGSYKVLLLQCGNCKSFNLQEYCNTIVFYTLDYSFIKYKQMIHRCWRLGQKRPTKIVILEHKDTVEEHIWGAVKNKQKMHDLYMNIKKSV